MRGREDAFVNEYLKNGNNATQAAVVALGTAIGSARVMGARYLQRERVKDAIAMAAAKAIVDITEDETEKLQTVQLSRDALLIEIARIAFSDVRKLVNADGVPIAIQDLDDNTARAIASIEVQTEYEGSGSQREATGRLHKIKFWDKGSAHERLLKYLDMYPADKPQEHVHRVAGLGELLDQLDNNGLTDTGPGPARSQRAH